MTQGVAAGVAPDEVPCPDDVLCVGNGVDAGTGVGEDEVPDVDEGTCVGFTFGTVAGVGEAAGVEKECSKAGGTGTVFCPLISIEVKLEISKAMPKMPTMITVIVPPIRKSSPL